MVLAHGKRLFYQCKMAAMNEKFVEVDTREDGDDDTHPEKISSFDEEEEASESKTRVHRFDMVLKHLHRLKSQMNNNDDNGNISNSSDPVQPHLKNKVEEESNKDEGDRLSTNIESNNANDTIVEERKISPSIEQNLQRSGVPLTSPIPPAFKELHKLQALKLLQQQSQQRGHYQGKERERKQLPHQRFPQHFGGPLSHHPSHRHSPPLPLKLPPPMRHPFFNHHHPQPINQPNNHYYSNSNNSVRNIPQPGYFSPPLSQRLSGQNCGPTSPAFPPVHQGNSNPNYPMPPPPLTRFPMPPGLMRALAPNLANIAPHMIQPLLDEAKNRLAAMQARMGSEGPQPPPLFPPSNSISNSPSSPPDPPHQGNKLSSLFPPMMKDIPMDWNNPMLSSTSGFKSPNTSDVQNTPLEGCSSSFYTNKDYRSKNDVSLNGRKDKDMRSQMTLPNDFPGLDGSFLSSNEDGRLDFTGDEEEDDEIFLEEDVGVDDDDEEEEELDGLGINVNTMIGNDENISKETNTKGQSFSQFKRKMASDEKITDRLSKEKRLFDGNEIENISPRKRKRTTSNEINEATPSSDEDVDTTFKENKKFNEGESHKDRVAQREDEESGKNSDLSEKKSKRMRSGSISPTPSTGGLSPQLQGSPGTPPLPPDARMFPPPFAYKLLEVRRVLLLINN